MTEISRTFTVRPAPETVLDYLKDFSHAEQWDPGTVECTQEDDAPIALGTRWHNKSKLYGISTELTYELTRDDPDHVVFSGSNKTTCSKGERGRAELTGASPRGERPAGPPSVSRWRKPGARARSPAPFLESAGP